MISYWIIIGAILLFPPFIAVRACLQRWPDISSARLLILSMALLPSLLAVILIVFTIAFAVESRSLPPESLDDAPERVLYLLWLMFPVIAILAACFGLLSGWVSLRISKTE